MIKKFWGKIDKIVMYKEKLKSDEARKASMDKHLHFLIEQSERYSELLAEQLEGGEDDPLGSDSPTTSKTEGGRHKKAKEEAEDGLLGGAGRDGQGLGSVHHERDTCRRLERPFLLSSSLKLREYQEAGIEWLVSMYDKRLNGILADEMGLGKTIQTISMLAHLACARGIWGPHLVIVPTSCIMNWEMEFKKWCPAFKVITYYGSAKERKLKRQGWSSPGSFHVCITSYQLVVMDTPVFKRKKWYFLILDEAHNIKNWQSQRWQTLLTFHSQRRLLLTGTPLQNNLMELWALLHFLMPHMFRSRKEFLYWFSNPMNSMVEGESNVNNDLVQRLHSIIRPFLLRRLKKDVEKQMPQKIEHIVMCKMSRRQRTLYEDFISRRATQQALGGGHFLGMMNILMQLRKVCNHPDLLEPRPIVSPLDVMELHVKMPHLVVNAFGVPHPFQAACDARHDWDWWCGGEADDVASGGGVGGETVGPLLPKDEEDGGAFAPSFSTTYSFLFPKFPDMEYESGACPLASSYREKYQTPHQQIRKFIPDDCSVGEDAGSVGENARMRNIPPDMAITLRAFRQAYLAGLGGGWRAEGGGTGRSCRMDLEMLAERIERLGSRKQVQLCVLNV
jgi:hypothetical protein